MSQIFLIVCLILLFCIFFGTRFVSNKLLFKLSNFEICFFYPVHNCVDKSGIVHRTTKCQKYIELWGRYHLRRCASRTPNASLLPDHDLSFKLSSACLMQNAIMHMIEVSNFRFISSYTTSSVTKPE